MATGSNRYTDLAKIASGHFAVIYRASDTLLDRPVALKCPREGLISEKPQYRAIFARESRFMASLEHPNIIPLYDYFESAQGPVIVMRLVPNTIQSLMASSGQSPFPIIVNSAWQIASCLDYCSARGVAHRDVKADNILLGDDQHVYLTDFGLAAQFDDPQQWTEPIGAKPFISPELFTDRYSGGKVEDRERSDEFSFGVLLYHLMTGSVPFESTSPELSTSISTWDDCTAYRLLSGHRMTPCSEKNPLVPARVDAVLSRMMSIDPADRYPSNEEAVHELDEALSGKAAGDISLFVSYSHADRDLVSQLVEQFEKAGITVWWDPNIDFGTVWEDEVERAMLESSVMLVVLSDQSSTSAEVKNEWRYWLSYLKKPLLTLVRDSECRIPYRLFPRQHVYANQRPINQIAAELNLAIRKAVAVSTAVLAIQPADTGAIKSPLQSYAIADLPVLYSINIDEQLQKINNTAYVPNNYIQSNPPPSLDLSRFIDLDSSFPNNKQ